MSNGFGRRGAKTKTKTKTKFFNIFDSNKCARF